MYFLYKFNILLVIVVINKVLGKYIRETFNLVKKIMLKNSIKNHQ